MVGCAGATDGAGVVVAGATDWEAGEVGCAGATEAGGAMAAVVAGATDWAAGEVGCAGATEAGGATDAEVAGATDCEAGVVCCAGATEAGGADAADGADATVAGATGFATRSVAVAGLAAALFWSCRRAARRALRRSSFLAFPGRLGLGAWSVVATVMLGVVAVASRGSAGLGAGVGPATTTGLLTAPPLGEALAVTLAVSGLAAGVGPGLAVSVAEAGTRRLRPRFCWAFCSGRSNLLTRPTSCSSKGSGSAVKACWAACRLARASSPRSLRTWAKANAARVRGRSPKVLAAVSMCSNAALLWPLPANIAKPKCRWSAAVNACCLAKACRSSRACSGWSAMRWAWARADDNAGLDAAPTKRRVSANDRVAALPSPRHRCSRPSCSVTHACGANRWTKRRLRRSRSRAAASRRLARKTMASSGASSRWIIRGTAKNTTTLAATRPQRVPLLVAKNAVANRASATYQRRAVAKNGWPERDHRLGRTTRLELRETRGSDADSLTGAETCLNPSARARPDPQKCEAALAKKAHVGGGQPPSAGRRGRHRQFRAGQSTGRVARILVCGVRSGHSEWPLSTRRCK